MLLLVVMPILNSDIYSDDITDLEKELEETEEQKKLKQQILEETEAELNVILNSSWSLYQKIVAIEEQISTLESNIENVKNDIETKEREILDQEALIRENEAQIEAISKRLYINSRYNLLELLMGTEVANDLVRSYVLKKYTLNKQLADIEILNQELGSLTNKQLELKNQKITLEAEEDALDQSKNVLAQQQAKLEEQLAASNQVKGQLQKEISILNDKITDLQEAILIARSGAFVPSIGSIPMADDYNASAEGFRSNAPSGSFSVFAIGAYTHRAGMSQYGAWGRALSGQTASEIINAYYKEIPVKKDINATINVVGYGEMDFETKYMYGIAEMPSSWHPEALKAQAIISRSYAYNNFVVNGSSINPTQSNQVFNINKANNPPESWKNAVDSTKGMVINNRYVYFSASTGGYYYYKKDSATPWTGFWDTTDGTAGADWIEKSYESKASSPWLYKAWYRILPHLTGIYVSPNDCGRGNPWLSEAEMADLINTWLVIKRNGVKGSVDESRILPVTINSCSYGGLTGNPYTMSDMKDLLSEPVTKIYGYPSVSFNSSGQTTSVSFSTDRGAVTISGADFKAVFNQRAPAYLSIPQFSNWTPDFALFNIERK